MALSEGTILNKTYEILGILGQGGFAVTYRARHIRLNSGHAIKEYFPRGVAERSGTTVYPADGQEQKTNFTKGLNSFLSEARNLTKFSHPNIVSIQDYFQENGTAYLVMPYLAGETLDKVLARCPGQKMNIQAIKQWLMPLLEGLAYLHANNFLHRDIKPSNIYLTDKATPILIDFGAARSDIGQLTHGYTIVFTPEYAPPEQHIANASAQGPWTDIFAIGAVMYRCLMGTPPPDSNARQLAVIHGEKDPIVLAYVQIAAAANDEIANTVCRCLDLNSKTRIRSVAELENLLDYSNSSKRKNTSANKPKDRQSEETGITKHDVRKEKNSKSGVTGYFIITFMIMMLISPIIITNIKGSKAIEDEEKQCKDMISNLNKAYKQYNNKDYDSAITTFTEIVNSSCKRYEEQRVHAANSLGYIYTQKENYYLAANMFEFSANSGNNMAKYNLGICYLNGNGVPKDENKAYNLFYDAANYGNIYAMAQLGYYYARHKKYKEALIWLERSAKQGNSDSHIIDAINRLKKKTR